MTTEEQIKKLARELRIHRIANLIFLAIVIAILVVAAKQNEPDSFESLTVNKLVVRESIDFIDANKGYWGWIRHTMDQYGATNIRFDSPGKSSIMLYTGAIGSGIEIKSDDQALDLQTKKKLPKNQEAESSIKIYSEHQLDWEEEKKLLEEYSNDFDARAEKWWELRNEKVYLKLTNNSGIKDIDVGGAVLLYNKEAKPVVEMFPDVYGNGVMWILNKKGMGRSYTSE